MFRWGGVRAIIAQAALTAKVDLPTDSLIGQESKIAGGERSGMLVETPGEIGGFRGMHSLRCRCWFYRKYWIFHLYVDDDWV
ncbi:MAG: hypothetical protein IT423_14060 [Pirellulaceae bacterium]|nr:hypothetical protein [Pirellulaceae bacterium]